VKQVWVGCLKFSLITLAFLLMLFVGVNAGGGDKDQNFENDKKTEVELDLAVC